MYHDGNRLYRDLNQIPSQAKGKPTDKGYEPEHAQQPTQAQLEVANSHSLSGLTDSLATSLGNVKL